MLTPFHSRAPIFNGRSFGLLQKNKIMQIIQKLTHRKENLVFYPKKIYLTVTIKGVGKYTHRSKTKHCGKPFMLNR